MRHLSPPFFYLTPASKCDELLKKGAQKVRFFVAKKKKFSQRLLKKIDDAGLPSPDLGITRKEFAKLQKQWYAKLAKEGFKDIEWVDHSTGTGHDSGYLKGSLISGKAYHPGRDLYYQLASNYLQHCKNLKNRPYHKFIWKLHAEGMTYDEIELHVKKRYKNSVSKYTLYYQIRELARLCYRWNTQNKEGLLRKRAEDKAAIEEKGLEEFYNQEYNWIINREFAASEVGSGKRISKNRR